MATSESPDPSRVVFDEPSAYAAAVSQLCSLAARELCLFDQDWHVPLYESSDWHGWLGDWLADPSHRLRVVLRDMEFADHYGERLKHQLRRFPERVAVHRAEGDGLSRFETLLIADQMHYIRRGDSRHPRGVIVCHDARATEPMRSLFEAIWQQSVVALTATTLGI